MSSQSVDNDCLKALVLHHCGASSSVAQWNYIHWVLEETTGVSGCLPYPPFKIRGRECTFLLKQGEFIAFSNFLHRSATEFSQNTILLFWTISSSPNVTTNMQQSTGKRGRHKRILTMAFALSSYLGHYALPHTQQLVDLHWLHLGKREGGGRNKNDHDRVGVHLVD